MNKIPQNSSPHDQAPIFSVDIGGTLIKAAAIDANGVLLTAWARIPTPVPGTPEAVLKTLRDIASGMPDFAKISVAFPGVVQDGHIITAPNLGNEAWKNFDLASEVSATFSRPVRILNDAIIQGLGVAKGPGLECLVTLGTGLGFALFRNAKFIVQLELGQHMARDGLKYDEYVGHAAFASLGVERWNERARYVLKAVRDLVHFDRLYIGGGNSRRIEFDLQPDEIIIPMTAGISGGARVWDDDANALFSAPPTEFNKCL